MIQIDPIDPGKAIQPFILGWMRLLANGNYDQAYAQLDEPNSYGVAWTPDLILNTLHDTFGPDTLFGRLHPEGPRFTDPAVIDQPAAIDIIAFEDGSGYSVDAPVPLNGEWSDMTAQFEFLDRQAAFAVVLHDLHVL